MTAIGPFVIQVNEAFIAAYPTAGQELGSIAHEPEIGVIVGSTCLTAHFGQAQPFPQTFCRAEVHRALHHAGHGIGRGLAEDFLVLRDEGSQHVAMFVFDA